MARAVLPGFPLLGFQHWCRGIIPDDEPALEAPDALGMAKRRLFTEHQSLLANGSVSIVLVAVVAACDGVANVVAKLYAPGEGGLAMDGDDLMIVAPMSSRRPQCSWWPRLW